MPLGALLLNVMIIKAACRFNSDVQFHVHKLVYAIFNMLLVLLSQFFEVPYDSQMARTRNRVLVRGLLR